MIKRTLKNRAADTQQEWLRHAAFCAAGELMDELNTTGEGLRSEADVERARDFYGANTFGRVTKKPLPLRFLLAFADPFTYILIVIAAISVATDWLLVDAAARDLTTPLIIGAMVLVSGVLRFVQDERSAASAESLAKMIEAQTVVEREGDGGNEIAADEVVVGDVVCLGSGAVVPADLRIIEARDLFVSQSSLTGESEPVEKVAAIGSDVGTVALADLPTIAFMGSTVISGMARGVVVATGERTMFGEVAGSLVGTGHRRTASSEGISSISRLLMRLMVVILPAVLVISGITKGDWLAALLYSLSVAVGLTPEMLPMLVTTCLAKGAVDLGRDSVIVKRLDAIQDLGGIDVLCTDKTGTLTEDRVMLERYLDASGVRSERVLRYAYLNSALSTGSKNLIDRAIIERGREHGTDSDARAEGWRVVDELPFDFERRRLSVVVENAAGERLLVCKGALAELLEVCSRIEAGGRPCGLTDELRVDALGRAEELERRGMRVLGLAIKATGGDTGSPAVSAEDEHDLVLMGYLAFLDPPKQSAADAVRALARHGVATKVLTGDSASVAACTCETIGISTSTVLTGQDIDAMDDIELAEAVEHVNVFAKLAPAQKARVIAALHDGGHTVGYMGDGANDAAAMRESDCGISVDTAVDVARDAADIILLEKDLMVLERGIVCGRRTFANMLKYVKMTVSSNFGNIISVLAAAIFLPFLPMSAVQLLLLNLIYDITCTAVPWDSVDDELVVRPLGWDTASVRSFMFAFGPVSSLFDILTFAALFWIVCPAVAGGAWGSLDAAGQALFVATFQAGWFVESMWTQTLVVHLLRSERAPFVGSRASMPLMVLGAAGICLVTLLPATPVGIALDMAALPMGFWPVLGVMVVGFGVAVTVAKRVYVHREGKLL